MNVLVIDDNSSVNEMLQQFLEMKGSQCTTILEGKSGLELMRKKKFDVVILDLAMPEFSGFDIIDALSKSGEIKNQKIVVLTAATLSNTEIEQLQKAGVKSIIKKPVSPDRLMQTISSIG